jgi:two-component system cell cycle response regulator
LRANTRAFDSLARYGGEEFVVVMPGTDPDDATLAAERLRGAVEALPFSFAPGMTSRLTVSIGVACCQDMPVTPEALLHAADAALYDAKHAGRNRVAVAGAIARAVAT